YTTDVEFMTRLFDYFDSEYLRLNMDTGNTFIAGLDPAEYLRQLRKYLSHAHIKDVSEGLASAARGEETGIAVSEVAVGGGVNAENIRRCIDLMKQTNWHGNVSIECFGSEENTRASVEFMRGIL
ncbi:MAG: sugar phosphate isomerase/epimerase, partial [Planctomycetes bacterium]|nr:sugar phosphate isomerase/epimerase [Planctomycetota bacterium]